LQRPGAAARLYAEAFADQPELAADLKTNRRYQAACAAALAGGGQGTDEPPLDETARRRWRRQALDWLRADLALEAQPPPQARAATQRALRYWQRDPNLAGVRDPDRLAQLPEPEQQAWRQLWAEVAALLKSMDPPQEAVK